MERNDSFLGCVVIVLGLIFVFSALIQVEDFLDYVQGLMIVFIGLYLIYTDITCSI